VKDQRPKFFYGWVILAAATLASFAQTATFNPTLSVFLKPMTSEFGWSRATFSGAVSLGSVVGGLMSLMVGPIVDRRGARLVLVAGTGVLGACLMLVSRFAALWQFYLFFGLGRAMSVGIIEVATMVAVSNWFIKKRGRAIGIITMGTRIGQALLPLFAQLIIMAGGWRLGWRNLALVAWAFGILPAAVFMKRRPEDVGLLPDGELSNTEGLPGSAEIQEEPVWAARAAIKTPAFWLITIAFAQTFMATGAINLHQLPHMIDVGISPSIAVGTVTTWALCAALGAVLWPFLAERVEVRFCLALALCFSALGVVILMTIRNVPMAYGYAVFYGFTFGGVFPLFALALANYFGRASLGTIRGMAQPLLMLANALGPVFAGLIYDFTSSYTIAFAVFIVAFLLGVPWVLLSRPPVPVNSSSRDR